MPDGDLFEASGRARASSSPTTSRRFTETGLLLRSGRELEADLVVTATGLALQFLGGMQLEVDGAPVDPSARR